MTDDDLMAWARTENHARLAELAAADAAPEHERERMFREAQANAKRRRQVVGLSVGAAAVAVLRAQKEQG